MSRNDPLEEDLEEESFLSEQMPHKQPRIFEGDWQESIPIGFNAVTVELEGRMQSDLNWKKARECALQAVEKGYDLMWDIHLGLFAELAHPLTHQAQFLSLTLALEHFRDSLWKEFKPQTVGLSFFRGFADFSHDFHWDDHQEQNFKNWLEEIGLLSFASLDRLQLEQEAEGQQLIRLYCRNVAVEYLSLLATRLPDSLPACLYLDATSFSSSSLNAIQLLNPERFDRLHLVLKGHRLPFNAWGWEKPTAQGFSGQSWVDLPPVQTAYIGVCIPPMHFYQSFHYQGLEEGIAALKEKLIPFKLIAECHLTSQWDGLDYLLYSPTGLSIQGKRKLQGFCAAGGIVVSTGSLLGLPYEIKLKDWLLEL